MTDDDAKKFRNQVAFGKPKQAAQASVLRGTQMVQSFKDKGKVTVKLRKQQG
ncbi:hypothetical protein [Bradyrhizobium sp. CIR3A]|uniref:hypothetical protein n=1 Tax=Bradyrhizobium sp. CIR3A TaxID=2663838 RepID=UPI00160660DB|nr:hypothetical protein [Bradyrhizobium sp. CIR3A]MBB4264216.1 hypothetical protein [Bradyrhizobium sp. CIR3A]